MKSPVEVVFWSIAFPGFGQILNGRIVKGILFLCLEFFVNINANINEAIILSFNGHLKESIDAVNYEWIMFYPCIYTFAIWDAYRDAGGSTSVYSFFPTVFSAYLGTLGVVFSRETLLTSLQLGPIWLGLFGMTTGAAIGFLISEFIATKSRFKTLLKSYIR